MAFWDNWLKRSIKKEIDELLKADGVSYPPLQERKQSLNVGAYSADSLPDTPEDHDASEQIGRKALIHDPYFEQMMAQVGYKTKSSRLSNKMLKEISVRDWLVSTIIQTRVDTLMRFSRPTHKKFEMGFRVVKKDARSEYTPEEIAEIAALEDFIYNCGRREGTPADDRMLFGEFLKLITRDALTFGHVAIEKVKTRGGGLHRFRPLPAESIYLINKRLSKEQIKNQDNSARQSYFKPLSDNDPKKDQQLNEVPIEYYKYVQLSYNMQPIAHFGDEDLIFKLFNPQNFVDSNGYCYSLLELAIINITNHLNVENYNANFFTHGYAARGVLHLKGTVTQAQLANFRRQFYNSISGQQHAWRTPIIAGLDDVQWVPMAGSAREMEYINFNNHLMRIICSMFQIDPVELGLDYLVSGTGRSPLQQANNEYKIMYSRERGLYPILMFIEDLINSDVLPAIDKSFSDKYKFMFVGYTDETAQTEIAQMQAEMSVWKSMNELLVQAQRPKINTPAADLPLNQAFWALVEKNYTRGEIREIFFGDKGASQRRELQYIPGDQAFMAWQQTVLAIENAKEQKKQMEAQANAQMMEQQMKQEKHQHAVDENRRKQEKHEAEMDRAQSQAAAAAVDQGNILRESAKEFGATRATNIGGKVTANPLNVLDENE